MSKYKVETIPPDHHNMMSAAFRARMTIGDAPIAYFISESVAREIASNLNAAEFLSQQADAIEARDQHNRLAEMLNQGVL